MRELYNNIFDISCNALCITTNGFRKKDGKAVMGRGIALAIQDYYSHMPHRLGSHLNAYGNNVGVLIKETDNTPAILAFPVKPKTIIYDGSNIVSHIRDIKIGRKYPGWMAKAQLSIIEKSTQQLRNLAIQHNWKKVLIPRPGCGAGELCWNDVKPILNQYLDNRFYAVTYSKDRKKYYAGIGARETPESVLDLMERISLYLYREGYTLRSGGANGADSAFAIPLPPEAKKIYIPWWGYNGLKHSAHTTDIDDRGIKLARSVIDENHWNNLTPGGKKLHARNSYQILGKDSTSKPVDFIICWTPKGKIVGGTATAIKLAHDWGIPVYNLGNPKILKKMEKLV